MPRYIDADVLTKWLKVSIKSWSADSNSNVPAMVIAYRGILHILKDITTADVVPKSEVDLYRKQVDELEDELASTYDKLEKAKAEFAELKKKYTEEKK